MKKIFLSLVLFVLLSFFVYAEGYELIDYDNFDNYSVGGASDLVNESFGKWNCSAVYGSDCVRSIGTGTGIGAVGIYNRETNNNYLRILSLNGNSNNHQESYINWYHKNTTSLGISSINYSISYDIKILEYQDVIGDDKFNFARFQMNNPYGLSQILYFGVGSSANSTESEHSKLRQYYNSGTWLMYPNNNDNICNVNNNQWNKITQYYLINSSGYLIRIETYINGVLCSARNSSVNYNGLGRPFFLSGNMPLIAHGGGYDIGIDNIKIYEGLVESVESVSSLSYCPLQNCIYFDDYSYDSISEFENKGYEAQDILFNVSDIYFNASLDAYSYFEYDFINDADYDIIEGILKLGSNFEITPDEFIDNPAIFTYIMNCDDYETLHYLNMYIIKDTDFTKNNESFVLHFTSSDEQKNLGTYTIDANTYTYIKLKYDNLEQKYYVSVSPETENRDYTNLYFPNIPDIIVPYASTCNEISGFKIIRRDSQNNDSTNYDLGIDLFMLYGGVSIEENEDYIAEKYNISDNDVTIETDWKETAQKSIYNLGFRSTAMKIIFVIICIIFAVFILSDLDADKYKIALSFIVIFILIGGFYLELIPLSVFLLILFMIAGVLALIYMKLFNNN